ncbi:E3 ubiquitin-protein ligase RNF144A isoform X2 [Tursiops truncatus]|uniref:E3 ubiquitin-protein ligase RNF144A isoform X2 n=1 Tax=Tursiops truncatus TaxID=9739 RepID=UPI003CCF33A6
MEPYDMVDLGHVSASEGSAGTPVPEIFPHYSRWAACHEREGQLSTSGHQDLARRPFLSSHQDFSKCLKQYVELLIKEGLETAISCPDAACPKQGHLQENEIECMVAAEIMQKYKKLQFEREVLLDPCRTWCPASTCQAVCQLQEMGLQTPQLVQCKACDTEFCSACKASWHPGQGCPETMPITFLPGETSSTFQLEEDDAPIKRCPKCKVYIERDEGCAQMMCKNCKHAFCWYCLESLDDDFLLIHYDKGPCRNKLGHSRASVIWHRTQAGGTSACDHGREGTSCQPSVCIPRAHSPPGLQGYVCLTSVSVLAAPPNSQLRAYLAAGHLHLDV